MKDAAAQPSVDEHPVDDETIQNWSICVRCHSAIPSASAEIIGDHVAQNPEWFHSALRSRVAGRRVSGIRLARDGCSRSGVWRVYSGVASYVLCGSSSCQMMPAPRKSRLPSPDESGLPWSPAILMRSGICSATVPAGVRPRVPATPTAATATRSSPDGPAREPPVHERWSLRWPPAPGHFWWGWTSPARRPLVRQAERPGAGRSSP